MDHCLTIKGKQTELQVTGVDCTLEGCMPEYSEFEAMVGPMVLFLKAVGNQPQW